MLWLLTAMVSATMPTPPVMPRRAIAQPDVPPPGRLIELGEKPGQYSLFVPEGYAPTPEVGLTVHFHTVAWFSIAEHLRRGLAEPLLVVVLGSLSGPYAAPFRDEEHFPALLEKVVAALGAPARLVTRVSISSFSAGYGSVREILRQPVADRIDRIVLCDSLYAGYEPGTEEANHADMAPWLPFCRAAVAGEKTFCLTYSRVPTGTYASTATCARYLAEAVGAELRPATGEGEWPLLERADAGRFHLWGYAGEDAPAHLTHVRHLADTWMALDAAR